MKLSEAEWQIMNALWGKYPATAKEIMERVYHDNKWAYTTVKTMLSRLVNKEAVIEKKIGNTSIYNPLLSKEKAQKSALKIFFNRILDGTVEPLMHFLTDEKSISKKEREKIIQLLQKKEETK